LLIADRLDALAEQFHLHYLEGLPDDHALSSPRWDNLSEPERESNRASALAIVGQLDAMGLTLRLAQPGARGSSGSDAPGVIEFNAEMIERLARQEHDRWMEHKRSQGWVFGPAKDGNAKPPTHPDLVPWEQLSEFDRDKDRRRIEGLPAILAAVGLVIVPLSR